MSDLRPIKATILDDDSFRLLAIPFGGPIPHPAFPTGVDLDGETFTERTDIKASWLDARPTDWHHSKDKGDDRYGLDVAMGSTVIGKAVNLGMDEEGWWVDVWLKHGERRLELIRRLASQAAATGKAMIFGSSEPMAPLVARGPWKDGGRSLVGLPPDHPLAQGKAREITVWPYMRQTLSTSPQNTLSVLRPLKATLEDLTSEGIAPSAAFWSDIEQAVVSLGSSLRGPSRSDLDAKAGRVLAARNESDLLAAVAAFDEAVAKVRSVLARQPHPQEGFLHD